MNKTTKKLLSVILVVAVCVSMLSSIVSFNAAASQSYSVVGQNVAAASKKVTVTVTLTDPNGLTSGTFDLMFGSNIIDTVNFDENGNYIVPQNETYDEFMARDTDGNFMIANVNFYKQEEYQVPTYDEEGNITGYVTKTRTVIDEEKSYQENTGNKGILLPNVYDEVIGLYDTKIEITGGTKVGGGSFDISDFVNADYETFAKGENNTTHAKYAYDKSEGADKSLVIDDDNDGRKYIYNMTDGYKLTHYSSTPITYTDVVIDGETVKKAVPDKNLLEKYYREYTTVDVATQNLGYKISTVSEDTIGSTHAYAQYAQGFKDITFNADEAYESITFTVTFDFTGTSDRISANNGVTLEELTGTTSEGVTYRADDGRWATENYVQNATKYTLNFVTDDSALSDLEPVSENVGTSFFHVHTGIIENKDGTAEPVNKAAIDALLAENPNAKEGVDYFELYNARCEACGRVAPMIAAPDLIYVLNGQNAPGIKGTYNFNSYRNISGVSVVYEDNGSLSLNVHYQSSMDGEQIFITDQNGMVMDYSDTLDYADERNSIYTCEKSSFASQKMTIETEDGSREVGRYSGELLSIAKMVTIKGFSASDIDKTLYVARYTPSSSTENQLMGMTHAISLSEYLNEVISGDYDTDDKLVAAALLNYSDSSKTALATPNDYKPFDKTDAWEADKSFNKQWDNYNLLDGNLADNGEKGTQDDPIIIDTAEEFAYLSKVGGTDTAGKYYKVADGIKYFDMSSGRVDLSKSLDDNLEAIKKGLNFSGSDPAFQGYFDGNGVTVYGIYNPGGFGGAFSSTKGNVTIKNLNVTMSCFISSNAAGGIIGKYAGDGTQTLLIENCSVTDCHIESTTSGDKRAVGAIFGYANNYTSAGNGPVKVNNCYINLDEEHFVSLGETQTVQSIHGGIGGQAVTNTYPKFTNCVVIGIKPWASYPVDYTANNNHQHTAGSHLFRNIYTDAQVGSAVDVGGTSTYPAQNYTTYITQLTTEQMTGENAKSNMSALDWDKTWHTNENDYPELYNPYNVPKKLNKTVYWDGTVATSIAEGSGTKADPYIINSASELAYIVKDKAIKDTETITVNADGTPKYFKVSDDIKNIVLQPQSVAQAITSLNDAASVKSYFESNASSMKKWPNYSWEATAFAGVFDGNGATVYGLYQVSGNNAGLFSTVEAGATIKNIALKNSYLTTTADNYQVGGIAAVSANTTKSGADNALVNNGIIWFDGCTVANNYMYNPATNTPNDRSGIIIGAASDVIYIDNCLIYDNDATYVNGKMPIVSSANNNVIVGSGERIPEGLVTVTDGAETSPRYNNMVRNSVILGNLPYDANQKAGARFNDNRCYQNVYSDAPNGTVEFLNDTSFTLTKGQIEQISKEDILGVSAKTVMINLDWNDASSNPNGKWYSSQLSAMPSLSPLDENLVSSIGTVVPQIQQIYDSIIFDDPDTIGDGVQYHANGTMSFGVYKTALSLKSDPYMSFAFAFLDDYQDNRDKIQIRFVYTLNGEEITTDPISPPAATFTDGDEKGRPDEIVNVNGWTNKKANGRYHTYKATDLPISAMMTGITVQMNYNEQGWEDFGTYDIEGIGYQFEELNAQSPSEYYQTRIEAAKALVLYIQARNLCFGV